MSETLTSREQRFLQRISIALDDVYKRVMEAESGDDTLTFDARSDRLIIFSDHHKGGRNRADDFRTTERTYNAALAYYYHMGHTLAVLGDVEELWEEQPKTVLKTYAHTVELEAAFHRAGRYLRFWGNHDDEWGYPENVRRKLDPLFGKQPLQVREGMCIRILDGQDELGCLFLVHGHQGTNDSDRWAFISKPVVRYIWRPLQRLTGISLNTPAGDWQLRDRHNRAMYAWASRHEKLVLIVGHTHRPVFASRSHEAKIKDEIAALEARQAELDPAEYQSAMSLLLAELEWVRSQELQEPGREQEVIQTPRPCYFNTGCCSFRDGKITGIELADGEIRLVRWPDPKGKPRPEVLERKSIREVFDQL